VSRAVRQLGRSESQCSNPACPWRRRPSPAALRLVAAVMPLSALFDLDTAERTLATSRVL